MIEEEAVGKESSVQGFHQNHNHKSSTNQNDEEYQNDVDEQDVEQASNNAPQEEVKSPSKVRRVMRINAVGNKKQQHVTKQKTTSAAITVKDRVTRSSKRVSSDDDAEDEEDDDENEDAELIEFDGEEEAAFANLGLHDIEEED